MECCVVLCLVLLFLCLVLFLVDMRPHELSLVAGVVLAAVVVAAPHGVVEVMYAGQILAVVAGL